MDVAPLFRRSTTRSALIGALIVCLALGVSAFVPGAARSAPASRCAASAGKNRVAASPGAALLGLSSSDLTRELTAARDAGVWSVRFDVDWSRIEPTRGARTWAATDRVVQAISGLGMCPMGVIGYTPTWAADSADGPTDSHFHPRDPQVFAAFVADAAYRYRNSIATWEIWNEPNTANFFKPSPNASTYGKLLAASYRAVKSVSTGLSVISGGMAPAVDNGRDIAPITFLKGLYANGFRTAFDAVGMHPYTYPAMPDDPTTRSWSAAQQMWDMHDVIVAGGDTGKLIWMTEFGAPTGTSSVAVSDAAQAQTVRTVLQAGRDVAWLGPAFVYSIRDAGTDLTDPEQNFGLLHRDFSPKPAYTVVKQFGVGSV